MVLFSFVFLHLLIFLLNRRRRQIIFAFYVIRPLLKSNPSMIAVSKQGRSTYLHRKNTVWEGGTSLCLSSMSSRNVPIFSRKSKERIKSVLNLLKETAIRNVARLKCRLALPRAPQCDTSDAQHSSFGWSSLLQCVSCRSIFQFLSP